MFLYPFILVGQSFQVPDLQALKDSLNTIQNISDSNKRTQHLDAFWDSLKAHTMIPFTAGEDVMFMYRSSANSVSWNGDWNSWGGFEYPHPKKISGTDLWIGEAEFPSDARLDYKIVANGNWILDPNNPKQQWSGFGPNSELQMPDYIVPPETIKRYEISKGALSPVTQIDSEILNESISYTIYKPFNYDSPEMENLPVVYVTDGHEYSDPKLGNMPTVLDNLIFDGEIPPLIAVFIDPRVKGVNKREVYYLKNPDFADFVAQELIPEIEATTKAAPHPAARTILGTSYGGLNSAYFAIRLHDIFDNIAMHSPALFQGDIMEDFEQAEELPPNYYIGTGTIYDNSEASQYLADFLSAEGYNVKHTEVHQGHSWGNWKGLIDEPLIFFWANYESPVSNEIPAEVPNGIELTNYPNPFNPSTNIRVNVSEPIKNASLSVFNAAGQQVREVFRSKYLNSGTSIYRIDLTGYASGTYFFKLSTPGKTLVQQMTFLK